MDTPDTSKETALEVGGKEWSEMYENHETPCHKVVLRLARKPKRKTLKALETLAVAASVLRKKKRRFALTVTAGLIVGFVMGRASTEIFCAVGLERVCAVLWD